MPKASVIISVWNDANHIASCIDSIKHQSMEDFECLVVDDGSTDGTFESASKAIAEDNRFRILRISHEGLSNARNVGFNNSKADIIFHMDADDIANSKMLEHSIDFLENNELEMLFFDAVAIDETIGNSAFNAVQRYFKRRKHYEIASGRQLLDEMTLNGDYNYAVFLQAIRRTAVRHNFYYGLRAQDMLYTTQNLFLAKRVGHLPEILYIKNLLPNSVSRSRHDAHYVWSFLKTITEIQKFAEEQGNQSIGLARVVALAFSCLTYGIQKLEKEDWNEIKKMSFTDRTSLFNLGRILHTPAIKRRYENENENEMEGTNILVD